MRRLMITLLAAGVLSTTGVACNKTDPNSLEGMVEKLENADSRKEGLDGLARLAKSANGVDDEEKRTKRQEEIAGKAYPIFSKVWDDVTDAEHVSMLEIMRDLGVANDASVELWGKAIILKGSSDSRKGAQIALQGIRDSKATGAAPAIRDAFDKLIDNPTNDKPQSDKGDGPGKVRLEYAKTLGVLRDAEAIPVLVKALGQSHEDQPVAVHKEAVKALGRIGKADPAVIDALLTVQFRVPDAPGTQNIGERAKRALVAIGPDATARIREMMAGKVESVNKQAQENGVDLLIVQQSAAGILGAMGDASATEDLVAFMPKEDCTDEAKANRSADPEEMDSAKISLRAFVANALGFVGDAKAVPGLCQCRDATNNPGDLWEITNALGRIGGAEAHACLEQIMTTGEYTPFEEVLKEAYRYEIRWEGARAFVLAAGPEQAAKTREVLTAQKAVIDKHVKKNKPDNPNMDTNILKWEPALKVLEECKADAACYEKYVVDINADALAREKAAVEYAKLKKGDKDAALKVSQAFAVRDPDARVTMAVLAPRIMEGKACTECADAMERVMKKEKGSAKAEMQLAWLTARVSMAKLTRGADIKEE